MLSTYKDNKAHHSSSRTYQSMPSQAVFEEIMYKNKIHSNPQSPLPHFKAANDWPKPISVGIVQITYTTKERKKASRRNKKWNSQPGTRNQEPLSSNRHQQTRLAGFGRVNLKCLFHVSVRMFMALLTSMLVSTYVICIYSHFCTSIQTALCQIPMLVRVPNIEELSRIEQRMPSNNQQNELRKLHSLGMTDILR